MHKYLSYLVAFFGFFAAYGIASAHEAYVLPYDTFWGGMSQSFSLHAFSALENAHDIKVTILIILGVLLLFGANFLFRMTTLGRRVHSFFERGEKIGPQFVRITIAVALLFSALSNSFLGPELHSNLFPFPHLIQMALFAMSFMIAFGVLTELAGLIGIIIFLWSIFIFGPYVFTYLNYLGELIVLLLFGMRAFSVDKYLFGPLRRFENLKKYETVIVRVLYGLALLYAAITVKILHPDLTLNVVNTWHLTKFHWLFPSDPLLVTFGAGIVEAVIGIFIIFGFELRLTVLISLFYITLSLLYFRELVWPHLMLYGISFNLLVQPESLTIDHFLFSNQRKLKSWWKRSFIPGSNDVKKDNPVFLIPEEV